MAWIIKKGWRFEAVELVKRTDKMVTYIDHYWSKRPTRASSGNFLPWEGSEETARELVAQLQLAAAELDRRRTAASEWFAKRQAEILAQAIEAGTVETERLDAQHESAVRKDAPNT